MGKKQDKKLDKSFKRAQELFMNANDLVIRQLPPNESMNWGILLDVKGFEICKLYLTKKGNLKPEDKEFFTKLGN